MRPIRLSSFIVSIVLASALVVLGSSSASAQKSRIAGAWRGNGVVYIVTGEREKVRCRATFKRRSRKIIHMNAICATAAARVEQTAVLKRFSRNRYSGTFHNEEFGVSGQIRVTIRGRRLTAALTSDVANATLHLRR